jgi:hypothetical protein
MPTGGAYLATDLTLGVEMITQIVELSGKPHEVSLDEQSKTVWIATGEYMGNQLEARGHSASNAIALWRMAARFMDDTLPQQSETQIPNFLEAAE